MLALDRHRQILDLLTAQRSVRTAEVAGALGVTEETVRRDFEKLEARGKLKRTHGGAFLEAPPHQDLPQSCRAIQNVAAKQTIARLAVREIGPGETLFLDSSSTAMELARALPPFPLRVVTNGLDTALLLSERPETVELIYLGGRLSAASRCTLGPLTERSVEGYHIQRAFISCRCVDSRRGFSEPNEDQARLRERVVALAEWTAVMADHSKMNLKSTFFFAALREVDLLITETAPPKPLAAALKAAQTRLLFPAR